MKVLATLAVGSALVAAPLATAAPWHVKVHVHSAKQGLLATCLSPSGGSVACRDELQCVQVNAEYATCIKKRPEDYDQCGGSSTTGEWKNECVGANTTCVFVSPYFYQCQNLHKREQFRFDKSHHHHHHKGAGKPDEPVPLYGQCKWLDSLATCAKDLQCIFENDHYGQCRSTSAKLYEQCGGKAWKDPWSAKCSQGDCVKRDEWYSQCLPSGSGDASKTPPPATSVPGVTSTAAAAKWEQCGGANYHGPTTCVPGTSCVKHHNWYSQCKPEKLPVGELCAEKKGDSNWSHEACEGSAKCVPSNPDQTESRCK